ncbi:MAG: methyltransferase domain-containing protein [Solirubrobacteraceae bacterium]
MLPASRERILESLSDEDLVLDVGGGGAPFARADWVIDLIGYADRGLYGPRVPAQAERFTADTWVSRDICDREPWPFTDGQFDFVVCSHTLEDVRDPVFVCDELIRVADAGYIEVPSRLEEQSYGFQGPWVGWGHHRWLIDPEGDGLSFVHKHHVMHGRSEDHFPAAFRDSLSAEQRVLCLWWQGAFTHRERVFLDGPSLDAYLAEVVTAHAPRAGSRTGPAWFGAGRRRDR